MAHGDCEVAVAGTPGAYSGAGNHGLQAVEHLQERMACRVAQLDARAEDMRDPVTKRLEMAMIRYNPQITEMEVQTQPDWRQRRSEGEREVEEPQGEEHGERLMARRRKRIRHI